MLDLDRRVFGRIMAREIIGARPPAVPDTKDMLAAELEVLLAGLAGAGAEELRRLLAEQVDADSAVNGRPGAMALAQDKIRLFNEYSRRYTDAIRARCDGGAPEPDGAGK